MPPDYADYGHVMLATDATCAMPFYYDMRHDTEGQVQWHNASRYAFATLMLFDAAELPLAPFTLMRHATALSLRVRDTRTIVYSAAASVCHMIYAI